MKFGWKIRFQQISTRFLKEMCVNEKLGKLFYNTCLYLYGT